MNQEKIRRINEFLLKTYSFKIPNEFIGNGKGDIESFINIEELMISNFKLLGLPSDISDLLKVEAVDFQNYKNKPEIKTLGLGYAIDSKRGKGPNDKEAQRLIDFFKDCSTIKNESKFITAKLAKDPVLDKISKDKATDFILIMKEGNWKQLTIKLLELAILELEYDFTSEELINYMIKGDENIFPFLIPLEITERLLPDLGIEFFISTVQNFIKSKNNNSLMNEFDNIHRDIRNQDGKIVRNKNYQKELKKLVSGYSDFDNYSFNRVKEKIKEINSLMETVISFEDMKIFGASYEMEFALRDKDFREKIGIDTKKSAYVDSNGMNEIINFYIKDGNLIYFSSIKENNFTEKVNFISNIQDDKKLTVYKLSDTTSTKSNELENKERVSILTKKDKWI